MTKIRKMDLNLIDKDAYIETLSNTLRMGVDPDDRLHVFMGEDDEIHFSIEKAALDKAFADAGIGTEEPAAEEPAAEEPAAEEPAAEEPAAEEPAAEEPAADTDGI